MKIKEEELFGLVDTILSQTLDTYFSYAWREHLGEFLAVESRYSKLVEWIDKEISMCKMLINVFCPADKHENYTNEDIRNYLSNMQKFSVLTHCRFILLDSRSNTKMRENIEYTLCKLYDISYDEELGKYI